MDFLWERVGEIIHQLEARSFMHSYEITDWRGRAGHFPITDRVDVDTSDWEIVQPGHLGEHNSEYFAVAATVVIPEEMKGMPVELSVTTGREGEWDATNPQIAAYVNGVLAQGLDINHTALRLTESGKPGEAFQIFMVVYTGERGSIYQWGSRLRSINKTVQGLYYDLLIPWQCLELMEEDSKEYGRLLRILNDTLNILDFRREEAFLASVEKAAEFLKEKTEELPDSDLLVSCIGHTHIDVAWLWTYAITKEKAARSFSTVLNLMNRYPEYQFMSSQAQLYKYVKENQPELYERIKERVEEGRWETEGGMFVEADCNLTSGESLVRQFLYGKKFFREEFGQDHKILWLPDVFGYSAALPQIMEKCGIRNFMTTKISWNETNKIPYDSFWWEGIDGTRILTHFITARDYEKNGKRIATGNEHTTAFTSYYNGLIHPSQVKGAWQRYQQKYLNDNVLISFGYGDGGGGPAEWMLETAKRLDHGKYGTPKVRQEKAGEFFARLQETAKKKDFPVWSGELYLEYHRGTYTSMAENKKNNRKGEFALQNAETWALLAADQGNLSYPAEELYEGWEILMRNQFHDVLPGSSVEEVYKDSREQYRELFDITGKIEEEALDQLTGSIEAEPGNIVVFNPNGMPLQGTVCTEAVNAEEEKYNCAVALDDPELIVPVQKTADGKLVFSASKVPAKGWSSYRLSQSDTPWNAAEEFYCTEQVTETPFYHLEWNEKGQISSFFDKRAQRELLQDGKCANVLMTYEDKPHSYDNWNIFEYYREKQWEVDQLVSRKVVEQGPVRIGLELEWKYLDSRITETLYFYPDTARIDICADIDWREDQILLKALFPLDLNAREATYEIQYGNVKRSITKNHSWEKARFEVCFQKWFDVAEYDYGISFITDSKYGVSVYDCQVELTLLKSGTYPNPKADRGHHEFVYSLYAHEGSWQEAGTVREAYLINNPMIGRIKTDQAAASVKALPVRSETIAISSDNIIAETMKASEDGKAEIIRLYECWNRRTAASITFSRPFRKVSLCNMLEEEEAVLAQQGSCVNVAFKPYEIVTLKIEY